MKNMKWYFVDESGGGVILGKKGKVLIVFNKWYKTT